MNCAVVPPAERAIVPELVTGEPLTAKALGTDRATDVTVPLVSVGLFRISASPDTAFQSALTFTSAPVAMPSSLVLSAELIEPAALIVAAEIEIAGAAPPLETIGAVPVTAVTLPSGVVCNAPVPSIYSAVVPAPEMASVPLVVIGEPETARAAGTVKATLVTVPDPPPPPGRFETWTFFDVPAAPPEVSDTSMTCKKSPLAAVPDSAARSVIFVAIGLDRFGAYGHSYELKYLTPIAEANALTWLLVAIVG